MSGGGGSKPKPVPVSEGEKIQTQLARDQIGYYRSTFAPLESEFRDVASRDHSARLSSQGAAASTRTMTPALAAAALGGGPVDVNGLAGATTASRMAGESLGRRERDDGALEAMGVGLGITADANRSLSQAGQIQTNAAIDRTHSEVLKMQNKADNRNAALGAIAAVGGAYGTKAYLDRQAGAVPAYAGTPQQSPATGVRGTPSLADLVSRANRSGGRP